MVHVDQNLLLMTHVLSHNLVRGTARNTKSVFFGGGAGGEFTSFFFFSY